LGRARQRRILVVDDDADFREILTRLLEHEGYAVVTSASGLGAIRHLTGAQLPSLILLDLHMPRLDGWKLLRIMRALGLAREIPVIVVSAYLEDRKLPRSRIAAALAKPVDPNDLMRTINRVFDRAA
jgi:CheY-like chemotaxis protein